VGSESEYESECESVYESECESERAFQWGVSECGTERERVIEKVRERASE